VVGKDYEFLKRQKLLINTVISDNEISFIPVIIKQKYSSIGATVT
jgi:hypothetical protein